MIFTTSPSISFAFAKIDAGEKFSKPCLLVAGSGEEPDYSQLRLTDYAKSNEWRAAVGPLLAGAERMKVPYVPPPDPAPEPPAAAVDENPPGAL